MKLRKDRFYYCAKDTKDNKVSIEKIKSHCAPKGCTNLMSEARRKPREKWQKKFSPKKRATSYARV